MTKAKTYTYAPWQLRAARRFLKQGGEDARTRAAKMSGLTLDTVDHLIRTDTACAQAVGRKLEVEPERPADTVRPMPLPPKGPEGLG